MIPARADNCLTEAILTPLRAATQDVHLRLHESPLSGALIRDDLSLQQYLLALQAFERFHQMLEENIFSAQLPYSPERSSIKIRHDLDYLNCAINPLPSCPKLENFDSLNHYFGSLYVAEGSKLGGRVIAKNIYQTLGFDEHHGASFFCGKGKQTASNWNSFLRHLEDNVSDINITVDAACKTFELLENWFLHVIENKTVQEFKNMTQYSQQAQS